MSNIKKIQDVIHAERYSLTGENDWEDVAKRVARVVAGAEASDDQSEYFASGFEKMIANKWFIPGGRILANAGRPNGQLLNCFVIPVEDSREAIGNALKEYLMIVGTGGGVGLSFSKLRPKGSPIQTNGGESSGPVPFMECIDQVANTIKIGGARRAATMLSLSIYHPDVLDFIHHKLDLNKLTNANVSVEADSKFFEAVRKDKDWDLHFSGKVFKTVKAKDIWNKLVDNAVKSGEPGVLNLGLMREMSNSYYFNDILTTNPCGEQPLPAYGSCCLGSVNVSAMVYDGEFDWQLFQNVIESSVRFLDNVLDINCYPLSEIKSTSQSERRIGLGIMGLHYAMIKQGIKYDSKEGLEFTNLIYKSLKLFSYQASSNLGKEKGNFIKFDPDKYLKSGFVKTLNTNIKRSIRKNGMRNVCVNTQAPTGTTSIMAGVSSGIEPIYAPLYERTFQSGSGQQTVLVSDPILEHYYGVVDNSVFKGALDISPDAHLAIQEIAQQHIDSAVSKTINLPEKFTGEELSSMWLDSADFLKGTTIYRSGSRGSEPLKPVKVTKENMKKAKLAEQAQQECKTGVCDL